MKPFAIEFRAVRQELLDKLNDAHDRGIPWTAMESIAQELMAAVHSASEQEYAQAIAQEDNHD